MADSQQLADYHVPPVGGGWLDANTPRWCTCPAAVARHAAPPAADGACAQLLQGCQCLIAIERAKLILGKPDPDSAYWN